MMVQCPHCKGAKGWKRQTTPPWIEPPEYEETVCWTCDGKGEIDLLAAAIYEARGGPAKRQWRGYA